MSPWWSASSFKNCCNGCWKPTINYFFIVFLPQHRSVRFFKMLHLTMYVGARGWPPWRMWGMCDRVFESEGLECTRMMCMDTSMRRETFIMTITQEIPRHTHWDTYSLKQIEQYIKTYLFITIIKLLFRGDICIHTKDVCNCNYRNSNIVDK